MSIPIPSVSENLETNTRQEVTNNPKFSINNGGFGFGGGSIINKLFTGIAILGLLTTGIILVKKSNKTIKKIKKRG